VFQRFSRTHGEMRDYLTGEVYGCPGRPDGTRIITSALVSCNGQVAMTSSGDRYLLDHRDDGESIEADDGTCTRFVGEHVNATRH
jgi:hypothetical protein